MISKLRLLLIFMCFIVASMAYAGALPAPTDFEAGTTIYSSQVNQIFDNIDVAVDGNAADISQLQGQVSALDVSSSVFRATDRDASGTYTGADIQATMDLCVGEFAKTGCIIELLNVTYTDANNITVPDGVTEIRPMDEANVQLKPTLLGTTDPLNNGRVSSPNVIYNVLYIEPSHRTLPLWIHDFHIDGNKQNWVFNAADNNALPDTSGWGNEDAHHCISVTAQSDGNTYRANGLIIERMHIENCGKNAIDIEQTENYVIKDNLIENVGCWDNQGVTQDYLGNPITNIANLPVWSPGGEDMGCGAWSDQKNRLALNQPGNKMEGRGINVYAFAREGRIIGNTIRYTTKLGIQTYMSSADATCASCPSNTEILNNHVSHVGAFGIGNVGYGYGTIISGNFIEHIDPYWQYANVGFGIQAAGGSNLTITNNVVKNTGSEGIQVAATCELESANGYDNTANFDCATVVSNNVIQNPCQGTLNALTGFDASGTFPFGVGVYGTSTWGPFKFGALSLVLPGGGGYQSPNPGVAKNFSWLNNQVVGGESCTLAYEYNDSYHPLYLQLPGSDVILTSAADGTVSAGPTDNSVLAYNTDGTVHEAPCTINDTGNISCSTAGSSVDLAADSTLGGSLTLKEGDDATPSNAETFTLKVPDATELTANRTCEVQDDDTPLDSCVSINHQTVFEECYTLFTPGATILDSYDIKSIWRAPEGLTISEVWCETDTGTVNADLQIDSGSVADIMGVDLACASTAVSDNTGLNGGMSDGNAIDIAITSVASSPTRLTFCFEYSYNQ